MADLKTKDFDTVIQDQVAVIQGGSTKYLVDTSIGSIVRVVVEAVGAVVMWLQGMVLRLLAMTRASTSKGADLDSWLADFGFFRLPAVAASGLITFGRFTATTQAVVPVGAVVQTADGTQQYQVIVDTGNSAYSDDLSGYVLPVATSSVQVPVEALTAGSAANAIIGGINALGQAVVGIDTATNAAPFVNGEDAESDSATRTRFVIYIASLSKGTKDAVNYAIASLDQGLTYKLVENEDYSGAADDGYFYVIINDGTGSPPSGTITAVTSAIDAVRPLTSTFGVFPPVPVTANVAMTTTTAAGYNHSATAALVRSAIIAYINGLGLGVDLAWSRLIQIAYDASPGITDVTGVTLNGTTSDLAIADKEVALAGTVAIA